MSEQKAGPVGSGMYGATCGAKGPSASENQVRISYVEAVTKNDLTTRENAELWFHRWLEQERDRYYDAGRLAGGKEAQQAARSNATAEYNAGHDDGYVKGAKGWFESQDWANVPMDAQEADRVLKDKLVELEKSAELRKQRTKDGGGESFGDEFFRRLADRVNSGEVTGRSPMQKMADKLDDIHDHLTALEFRVEGIDAEVTDWASRAKVEPDETLDDFVEGDSGGDWRTANPVGLAERVAVLEKWHREATNDVKGSPEGDGPVDPDAVPGMER